MKIASFFLNSLKTRVTVLTLAIFVTSIWLLVLYASAALRDDVQALMGQQQYSTTSLLGSDIEHEIAERLSALQSVASEITPALLRQPTALQTLLQQQLLLTSLFNDGVAYANGSGTVLADWPHVAGRSGANFKERDYIIGPLTQGRAMVGKPVRSKLTQNPFFVMAVPVKDAQGAVVGVLAGVINLNKPNFLFEITQGRTSQAGDYFLVAAQHGIIVTSSNTDRIMATLPAPGISPALDRQAQGWEGTHVFVNPLGVEVLTSVKQIPSAGWYVALTLATATAYAPITALQHRLLVAATLLSVLAGLLTWWLLRRQLAPLLNTTRALAALTHTSPFPSALPVARDDEVGHLVAGLNQLLAALRQRDVALNESEARFRTLIEWTPEAVAVHRAGKLLYANPAALQLFGAPIGETLVGKSMLDFVHPDYRTSVLARMQRSYTDGRNPPRVEEKFLKLDGTAMDVEVAGIVINYDGQSATQVTMHDVTERNENQRQMERLLREQKAILDSDLVGIVRLANRTVQWCNGAFEKMLGYGVGELLGTSVRQHYASDEAYQALAQVARPVLAAGRVFRAQAEFVRGDGSPIWVELNGVKLSPEQDESLWILLDITERRQAEEKLRTFSRIVEQAPLTIVITDLHGNIEYGNPWLTEVTGYSAEELIGKNPRLFQSGKTAPQVYQDMWQTLTAGQVWRGEFSNRNKNGEIYLEQAVIAPVLDDDGHVRHYVALKEDITERKQTEHALQSSLQEKVALLNEVHHRVKNNLQVITSLLRLEAGRSAQPETKSVLGEMQNRIRAMALLHESLYRSGTFASIDLSHYLKQIATQAIRAQGSGAVRLILDTAPVQVSLDQAMPCGLLVNELISNSLKHGFPEGRTGEIRIELQAVAPLQLTEDGTDPWRLCVHDTGIGLPADFQTRRGESLGLQLVSDLARQFGGKLEIGAPPDAAFCVTFTPACPKVFPRPD